jgi:hypothetical protein
MYPLSPPNSSLATGQFVKRLQRGVLMPAAMAAPNDTTVPAES